MSSTEYSDPRLAALAGSLDSYCRRYPAEIATTERFRQLLADGPRAFTRANTHAHFTGSAVILDPSGRRTLLTHHRKLDMWLQLGGHADGELDLAAVALQEAVEESGLPARAFGNIDREILDIDIHRIPARPEAGEHFHYDVRYLLLTDPTLPLEVSDESHDLRWVEPAELSSYSSEQSLLRAIGKAIDRLE